MILCTAKQHFDDDVRRARAIWSHAQRRTPELRCDLLRSSWMFAVGACDAYFADAYADLIARTLQAKEIEPGVQIPDRLSNLRIPVIAVIREAQGGWRWRMAARELIEKENVLSLEKVKQLFGQFYQKKAKPITTATLEPWIRHSDAKVRVFGISARDYGQLTPAQKPAAKESALEKLNGRFELIFQRRHDCIHNCDRPKLSPQTITCEQTEKTIEDVSFLVERMHESLIVEFPSYLKRLGFSAATRNRVR